MTMKLITSGYNVFLKIYNLPDSLKIIIIIFNYKKNYLKKKN
jgi:hypothetical protein